MSERPIFDVRQVAEEARGRHTPFEFIGDDGETYELPNPQLLAPDDLRKALGVPDSQADRFDLQEVPARELIRAVAPGAFAQFRLMPGYVQAQLVDRWVEHCELTLESGKGPSLSSPNRSYSRR